jgi:hypothetical protein
MTTTGPVALVEIACEPARLDTPGIADTEPYPSVSPQEAGNVIGSRLREWAERFEIGTMSDEELLANRLALQMELARSSHPPDDLRFAELTERIALIDETLRATGSDGEASAEEPSATWPANPPDDRWVIARGEDSGMGWEIFTLRSEGEPVLGFQMSTGEWGTSEIRSLDPCRIESDAISWHYLRPRGGYPTASPPAEIVVLQFHAVPPEADAVRFRLNDGRVVDAELFLVSEERAPWDVFAAVFRGPPEIRVEEIVIETADGSRLDDPAVC